MSRYIDADSLIESICHTADLDGWIGDTLRNIKRLAVRYIDDAPSIDIVRCRECKYWGSDGGALMICDIHKDPTVPEHFCSYGERNSSEKPNNCEHITEDGVTCAKYPACDDCLDNPLNKVKGSERLLKGKDEPQTEREGE